MRIAIIGAGLSGASCTYALRGSGRQLVVFEQDAEVGGRLHTHREGGWEFDCGAQYFTARDPRFLACLEPWQKAGLVAPWQARVVAFAADGSRSTPSPLTRWTAVPGMQALAGALFRENPETQIRVNSKVARIAYDKCWSLFDAENQSLGAFDWVLICTPPAPALSLFRSVANAAVFCDQVVMSPNWTLMLGFEQSLDFDFDAAFVNGRALSWICRNNSKPGRSSAEAWVLQAAPDWSAAHSVAEPARVQAQLTADLAGLVGPIAPASLSVLKYWKAALGHAEAPPGCFICPTGKLGLAGDWCHEGRVEGAFLSGLALARGLLAAIEQR